MIAASLALALAIRTALVPIDTAFAQQPVAVTQPAADSDRMQPARFDPTRFDSATAGALRVIFDTASAHGIPTGPLVNQALHGAALHAPGAKILSVVRGHYAAMLDARAALGENASESELDSGAEALKLGIDGKTLVAIRATRPVKGTAVSALVVVTDLVKRGIPGNKARDAVTALARVSKSDEGLNGLQQLVARNAERGPGMAQDALDRYLRTNVPGNTPKPVTRPPGLPDAQ